MKKIGKLKDLVGTKEPEEEYNELYPDEGGTTVKENVAKEIESTAEIPKVDKESIPTVGNARQDIINRLIGIQNIVNETPTGKWEKVIRLAEECKLLLEQL